MVTCMPIIYYDTNMVQSANKISNYVHQIYIFRIFVLCTLTIQAE